MDVSENRGFSTQTIHLKKKGVFHYFHNSFWGVSPYFWKHPYIHIILIYPAPSEAIGSICS